MVDQWQKASGPGKPVFVEGGGQAVALPFSLRGFRQAMNALGQSRN